DGITRPPIRSCPLFMVNNQRDFVLELDIVSYAVIEVEDGGFISSFGMAFVEGEGNVDFPVLISRRTRIVGKEWGACKSRPRGNQKQQGKHKKKLHRF